jgi:hypothetical protein
MDDLPREDVLAAIDRTVDDLLAVAGISGPPVDAVALARQLGVEVEPVRTPQRTRPVPQPSAEQQQWSAAQAVARSRKAELLGRLGIETGAARGLAGGTLTNLCAQHLLTPAGWFARDSHRCGFDLLTVKEQYRTAGCELIAWRWLELPDPCVVAVVVEGRVQKRRSNSARAGKTLSAAELECLRAVEGAGKPRDVRRDGWTVQGWPVPPGGARRVILRGAIPEGDGVT